MPTLFMNEEDKNKMLNAILPEGESYIAGASATIMGGTIAVLALGALSNVYCYLGVTEKHLCIAVAGTLKIDEMQGKYTVPYENLTKLSVGGSLVPKQKIIKLQAKDGTKLKIAMNCYNMGTKVVDQAGNATKIAEVLKAHKR